MKVSSSTSAYMLQQNQTQKQSIGLDIARLSQANNNYREVVKSGMEQRQEQQQQVLQLKETSLKLSQHTIDVYV